MRWKTGLQRRVEVETSLYRYDGKLPKHGSHWPDVVIALHNPTWARFSQSPMSYYPHQMNCPSTLPGLPGLKSTALGNNSSYKPIQPNSPQSKATRYGLMHYSPRVVSSL